MARVPEPAGIRAAREELASSLPVEARSINGHYVLPYCKMLRKEALESKIQRWERTQSMVKEAFGDAGQRFEIGGDSSLMPAGLEAAVPLSTNKPLEGEESVVWFPSGPGQDVDLDAGMNQLLAEARESDGIDSRGASRQGEEAGEL